MTKQDYDDLMDLRRVERHIRAEALPGGIKGSTLTKGRTPGAAVRALPLRPAVRQAEPTPMACIGAGSDIDAAEFSRAPDVAEYFA